MSIDTVINYAFRNRKGSLTQQHKEIQAMRAHPREKYFLTPGDERLPWSSGELVQEDPRTIRHYLEHLHLDNKKRSVLEIGTGTGWLTALLVELGAQVTSYEINKETYKLAEKNLRPYLNTSVNLIMVMV